MELKDMILSTLAELEEVQKPQASDMLQNKKILHEPTHKIEEPKEAKATLPEGILKAPNQEETKEEHEEEQKPLSDEKAFYENLRERILVLFEGFQSPNNKNIEAKLDLTLNFLEYLLASIDERLENLEN